MRAKLLVLLTACGFQGAPLTGDGHAIHDGSPVLDGNTVVPDGVVTSIDAKLGPDAHVCGGPCFKRKLTITADKIGTTYANFPLFVQLAGDASLAANALDSGFDIGFTDGGGGALAYERTAWNPATGDLQAWVNLPSVPSGSDFSLYLTYGLADQTTDLANPTGAWAPTYRGVYHLDETTGTLHDSTTNVNTGTPGGGAALGSPGRIGASVKFGGVKAGGAYPSVTMLDKPSLDAVGAIGTLSMWVKFDDASSGVYQGLLTNSNIDANDGFVWALTTTGDYYFYPWAGDTNCYDVLAHPFSDTDWHWLAIDWDFGQTPPKDIRMLIDGNLVTPTPGNTRVPTHWSMAAKPADWRWGGNAKFKPNGSEAPFIGSMDEIRIEATRRSDGFLKATYLNQANPSAFYQLGAVEPQ